MDAEILQQLRSARCELVRSQGHLRTMFLLNEEPSEIETLNIDVQVLVLQDAIATIDTVLLTHGIN